MAQDSGSSSTPLPVVGCEVEFTPDQQYKVMRSGTYIGLEFNVSLTMLKAFSPYMVYDRFEKVDFLQESVCP